MICSPRGAERRGNRLLKQSYKTKKRNVKTRLLGEREKQETTIKQPAKNKNTKTRNYKKKNAKVSPSNFGQVGVLWWARLRVSLSGTGQPRAGPGQERTRHKRLGGSGEKDPGLPGREQEGDLSNQNASPRRQTTRSLTAGPFGDRAAVYLLWVATFAHPGPSPNLPAAACQHTVHNRPGTVADPQLPPALSLPPTCIRPTNRARTQTEGLLRERVATDLPGDPSKDLTIRRIFASERGSLQAL